MVSSMNDLKKHVFYEMIDLAGRVFVHVGYSENVVIGNRGFLKEEEEKGIVLVFNKRMNFVWEDDGISVTLVFGTSPEKCFVPAEDILSVFSPELNAQFTAYPSDKKAEEKTEAPPVIKKSEKGQKVVRVDFHKRK
ncbi:MAG: hypothetical protein A2X59_07860 [Nitrospirae bacterium GWC2_42_7]|nr:MAG: hypothetical protein A2X59_07860 [Nitrospirae bacterium GWC2_42_7]